MNRVLCLLVALVVALGALGCGGDGNKGVNKDKDKPREAPAEKK